MPDSVPAKFEELIEHLTEQIGLIGKGVHNAEQRPWLDLQDLGGAVSNFDIAALHEKFDRQEANDKYTAALQKEDAEESEVTIPKLAADFMASFERDFVDMRKRSRVRMMVHTGIAQRDNEETPLGQLHSDTMGFLSALQSVKITKSPRQEGGESIGGG